MPAPVRLVAQYFPQFHAIPDNDRWWGPGFTDWVNVKRATAQHPGHYQPRLPLGANYYDQSTERTVRWQAELARAHGIAAFCHYHYWFDGTRLLSAPTDMFLAHKDIQLEFCLAWANETWSRRWDGQEHHILIAQHHPPTVHSWGRHFDVLIKSWLDERALRVDGRPVFLIYRPARIHSLDAMFDYWRSRAHREYGLDGLYFVAMIQRDFPPWEVLRHFDAAMLFQPFAATEQLRDPSPEQPRWRKLAREILGRMPLGLRDPIEQAMRWQSRPTRVDYDRVWQQILAWQPDPRLPVFEGAFVDWDNTPRYQNRATIYQGATPEKFERWMYRLMRKAMEQPARESKQRGERLVFINAWNEWAESAYLEPDQRWGMAYLEGLRRALDQARADSPRGH